MQKAFKARRSPPGPTIAAMRPLGGAPDHSRNARDEGGLWCEGLTHVLPVRKACSHWRNWAADRCDPGREARPRWNNQEATQNTPTETSQHRRENLA